ncbi:MAG: hypothetical protein GPJ54_18075 [Candidatus Heimdallarchaeota archaeon]|nr:hypothetical protein [Candidatus Heimdallarchaeota archaeon]
MNIESQEKIQNIQAEDINSINNYISRIELILLDKFDQEHTNDILKFEREKIFEAIELAEITSREFNISSIIEKRESQFQEELKDSEENEVLSFLNFDFVSQFFNNLRRSPSIGSNKEDDLRDVTGTELFIAYFILLPILILSIAPRVDGDVIFTSQVLLIATFSIYVNVIPSSLKRHLFTLYSIGLMAMFVTASVHINNVLGIIRDDTGSNTEEIAAIYVFVYSSILYFGLVWKMNSFDKITADSKPDTKEIYYFLKIIFNLILAVILATVTAIYAFVRAGLTLETENIYPFMEFVILLGLILNIRGKQNRSKSKGETVKIEQNMHESINVHPHESKAISNITDPTHFGANYSQKQDREEKEAAVQHGESTISSEKVDNEFSISSNLKDKIVKVTIDKQKYKDYASIKLFSKKKLFFVSISIPLISWGIFLAEISTSQYNNLPDVLNDYIYVDQALAFYLSFIVGLVILSLILLTTLIHIVVRLRRRDSKDVIHNLALLGDFMEYEDLYHPKSGMTVSNYLSWLGELTFRDIVSIELQG